MRKLAYFAAAFSGSVLLAVYALPLSALLWAALGCTLLGGIAALILRGGVRLRAALILAGLCLGFGYHWGYTQLFYSPAEALAGQTLTIEAQALDYAQPAGWGGRVDVRAKGAKMRLYLEEEVDIIPGDRLLLTARLAPAEQLEQGEIDYYKTAGIQLLAYQKGELELQRPERLPLRFYPKVLRHMLSEKLAEIFPEDVSPFLQALVLGDKSAANQDQSLYASLDRSGIRHVIAVSGMHLAFLVSMVRRLSGRRRRTAFICIPVILLFMALVGFPTSVVRAGIMQILLLAAPLFRREEDTVTSLSLAALVILLLNPWAAGSAAFQLSFAAVAGISLISGKLYGAMGRWKGMQKPFWGKLLRSFAAAVSSTLGAMVFTAPLMALHFGYISLISPLTNVLTLWAVSLSFILGLAACVLSLIWLPLGAGIAFLALWPVRYILFMARLLAKFPFAALYTMNRYVCFFLCYLYALLGLLWVWRKEKRRLILPVCCGALALGAALLLGNLHLTGAEMTVTALDVGQGQSLVLTAGAYTVLIDCGGSGDHAGNRAADFLAGMGKTKVDALILTHWHDDHVNGVEQLLERTQTERLFIPREIDDSDGNARP